MADLTGMLGLLCGAGICVGFIAIIAFVIIGSLKGATGGKMRTDAVNIANANAQFEEFKDALDAIKEEYGLKYEFNPGSFAALTAAAVGKKGVELLSGTVSNRQICISARMAGDALTTQIEATGKFALPIDIITDEAFHVQGLGMELRYIGGTPLVKNGKIQIRPEFNDASKATKKALDAKTIEKIERLIYLKPKKMNLSAQLTEQFSKKMTFFKDRACIRDYGLVRDAKYFDRLMASFLGLVEQWEGK